MLWQKILLWAKILLIVPAICWACAPGIRAKVNESKPALVCKEGKFIRYCAEVGKASDEILDGWVEFHDEWLGQVVNLLKLKLPPDWRVEYWWLTGSALAGECQLQRWCTFGRRHVGFLPVELAGLSKIVLEQWRGPWLFRKGLIELIACGNRVSFGSRPLPPGSLSHFVKNIASLLVTKADRADIWNLFLASSFVRFLWVDFGPERFLSFSQKAENLRSEASLRERFREIYELELDQVGQRWAEQVGERLKRSCLPEISCFGKTIDLEQGTELRLKLQPNVWMSVDREANLQWPTTQRVLQLREAAHVWIEAAAGQDFTLSLAPCAHLVEHAYSLGTYAGFRVATAIELKPRSYWLSGQFHGKGVEMGEIEVSIKTRPIADRKPPINQISADIHVVWFAGSPWEPPPLNSETKRTSTVPWAMFQSTSTRRARLLTGANPIDGLELCLMDSGVQDRAHCTTHSFPPLIKGMDWVTLWGGKKYGIFMPVSELKEEITAVGLLFESN